MDITILLLTSNNLPVKWQYFHQQKLLESIGDRPIISVSRVPMDIGRNILQDRPPSKPNIFYQMMRGMRIVETEYTAIVEDDTLYPPDHFKLRPPKDAFLYNKHRWSLYTWNPIYNLKNWIKTGAVLITPTKLALELLEERFNKYPIDTKDMPMGMCGELGIYEKELGIRPRRVVELMSKNAVVQLDHDFFTKLDPKKETIDRRHRKSLGTIQAYDIPYWGKSSDIVSHFNEK